MTQSLEVSSQTDDISSHKPRPDQVLWPHSPNGWYKMDNYQLILLQWRHMRAMISQILDTQPVCSTLFFNQQQSLLQLTSSKHPCHYTIMPFVCQVSKHLYHNASRWWAAKWRSWMALLTADNPWIWFHSWCILPSKAFPILHLVNTWAMIKCTSFTNTIKR